MGKKALYIFFKNKYLHFLRFVTGLLIYGGYGMNHSQLERESVTTSSLFSPDEDLSPLVVNEDPY